MRTLPGPLVSSKRSSMRRPTSLRSSTPKALAIRFFEPKAFMRSGKSLPFTLWKRRAGPVRFMTRSAISVISNFALTGSRTSTSSPSLRKELTNSCRLLVGTFDLPYRVPDAGFGTLLVLTGDDAEELRQMWRPEFQRDRVAAYDLTGSVPDHTSRHPDEARLVQPRYGLDRPGISVVPNEYRLVVRGPGCIMHFKPLLQISQCLGDNLAPVVLARQASCGAQKDLLERNFRCPAGGLHVALAPLCWRLHEPLPSRFE